MVDTTQLDSTSPGTSLSMKLTKRGESRKTHRVTLAVPRLKSMALTHSSRCRTPASIHDFCPARQYNVLIEWRRLL
ncbi:hypothetical protein BDZ89DRAFT_1073340 [Hymenopellis radicata]|nr:hypothetical protein BDZ89DRAFT_1073340 [Hymenopellis radicata]